ncbi:PEGA domain-containing protein [Halovalidus salilacus]|uniref:PEGA domain-containing protein n=1 Tax=Halovalidus salilacus TaxID=3075124 RepID=UPI0036218D36
MELQDNTFESQQNKEVDSGSSLPPLAWEWTGDVSNRNQVIHDLVETQDGAIACAGMEGNDSGVQDVLLQKIDSSGEPIWGRTFGADQNDAALGVVESDNGSLVLCGGSMSEGSNLMDTTVWLAGADGTLERSVSLGRPGTNDAAHAITPGVSSGFLLGGGTHYLGGAFGDGVGRLVKIDDDGFEEWSTTMEDGSAGEIYDVATTGDSKYAFVGTRAGEDDEGHAWLGVVDRDGDLEWSKTYGASGSRIGYSLIETDDGGFAFAGTTQPPGQDEPRAWVVKVDLRGDVEWERTYGGTGHDALVSINKAMDEGYILGGWTEDKDDGDVGWLLHIHTDGELVGEQTYGDSGRDRFNKVVKIGQGYSIGGFTTGTSSNPTAWVAKAGEESDSVDIAITREKTTVKSPVTVQVTDPDENEYEYRWRVVDMPSGSSPGLLHGENEAETPNGEFVPGIGVIKNKETKEKTHAVLRPDVPGTYTLEIEIRNADGSVVNRDQIEISVDSDWLTHDKMDDGEYPGFAVDGIETASELAEAYAPVYHFHSDEKYFPTRFEAFVENSELRFRTTPETSITATTVVPNKQRIEDITLLTLGDETLDPDYEITNQANELFLKSGQTDNPEQAYQNYQKEYPPTIHASVTGTEYDGEEYVALTYWAFYLFDPKKGDVTTDTTDAIKSLTDTDAIKSVLAAHASDLETVTILFDQTGPQWVAAAQHYSGEFMRWQKVAHQAKEGPLDVYPAKGAHSSFLVNTQSDKYEGNIPGQYRWLPKWQYHLYVSDAAISEINIKPTDTLGPVGGFFGDETGSATTWSFEDGDYDLVMLSDSEGEDWRDFAGKFKSEGVLLEGGPFPHQRSKRWNDPGQWFPNHMLPEHDVLSAGGGLSKIIDYVTRTSSFVTDENNRITSFEISNFKNPGVKPHTFYVTGEITTSGSNDTSPSATETRTQAPILEFEEPLGWNEDTSITIPLEQLPAEGEISIDLSIRTYPERIVSNLNTSDQDTILTVRKSTVLDLPTISVSFPNIVSALDKQENEPEITPLSNHGGDGRKNQHEAQDSHSFSGQERVVTPGDDIKSNLTVTNEGDTPESLLITLLIEETPGSPVVDWPIDSKEVSIGPGESQEVTLSWEVTEEIPEGTYDMVTEVWLETDPDNLTTQLNSKRDSNAFAVEKPMGELDVTSTPEEAMVTVDGEILGVTPLNADLPIGTYEIAVINEEYEPVWDEVSIDAGETTVVSFELHPLEEEKSSTDVDSGSDDGGTDDEDALLDEIRSHLDVVVVSALAGFGSAGYLIKRRLTSEENNENNQ